MWASTRLRVWTRAASLSCAKTDRCFALLRLAGRRVVKWFSPPSVVGVIGVLLVGLAEPACRGSCVGWEVVTHGLLAGPQQRGGSVATLCKGGPRCKEGVHLRRASLTETQTQGQAPSRPRFVCRVAEEDENTWGRGHRGASDIEECGCVCLRVPSSFPSQ